ncbi:Receptor-type tyrosine-protein phosphatase C [Toxocara canis]|uniref:Receptor-type tyrosine-protein phosphatase C n=1 Tax=Toxocara canis TaxID=6265 RepID=A0A0B2W1T4_TOXCA|nr:Receptor-type tyrosine-protein phosphatase C [Toxocara canis]
MERLLRKAQRLMTIRDGDEGEDEEEPDVKDNDKHKQSGKSKQKTSKRRKHHRKHKSRSTDGKEDYAEHDRHKSADSNVVFHVNKWLETTLDKGVDGLKRDFETIKLFVPDPYEATVFENNKTTGRNRYRDLPCLDQTRVILANDTQNNYIHANYVKMALMEPKVICTQAPLDSTVHQFYQMILQEGARMIIMLCNFTESGRKICTQYYPAKPTDPTLVFGDITVVCLHSSALPGEPKVCVTWLSLKCNKTGKRQTVRHIHWKDWPEHSVPDVSLTPLNIFTVVRDSKGPVVIHCVDGVSRTGTILGIEFILEKMLHGEASDDSTEMIKELRRQRALAVRTSMQYIYIHREIIQYLQDRQIIEMSQRLLEFVDDYDRCFKKYAKEEATPPFHTNEPKVEMDEAKTAYFAMFETADYFNVPKSTYCDSKTQVSPPDRDTK